VQRSSIAAQKTTKAMPHSDQRPYFESLDLVRGLAALVVLIYHVDFMFGLRDWLLHGGYLAVDLFFVLSGFVLSLTYGHGVASGELSVRRYMVARFARLFPLFLATTCIGFIVMTARYRSNYGDFDTTDLIKAALLNVFMVPSFATLYDLKVLFPFNPATWSIFFEMIASILFFFFFGRANRATLAIVAAFAWLVLAATVTVFGTLDVGYASDNFIAGFPRVIFSFTAGVLIERAYAKNPWRCPALLFYVLLPAWLLLMQARSLLINPYVFDLVSVTVFLPALVAAGAGVALTGRARLLAILLGQTSYAVYLTQGSLIIAAAGASQILLGKKIYDFAPGVGFLFIPLVVLISYLTYCYYEQPARIAVRRFGEIRTLNSVGTDSAPPQR